MAGWLAGWLPSAGAFQRRLAPEKIKFTWQDAAAETRLPFRGLRFAAITSWLAPHNS